MLIKADINNDKIRANSLYINHNTECNLGKCNQNKKKTHQDQGHAAKLNWDSFSEWSIDVR